MGRQRGGATRRFHAPWPAPSGLCKSSGQLQMDADKGRNPTSLNPKADQGRHEFQELPRNPERWMGRVMGRSRFGSRAPIFLFSRISHCSRFNPLPLGMRSRWFTAKSPNMKSKTPFSNPNFQPRNMRTTRTTPTSYHLRMGKITWPMSPELLT